MDRSYITRTNHGSKYQQIDGKYRIYMLYIDIHCLSEIRFIISHNLILVISFCIKFVNNII